MAFCSTVNRDSLKSFVQYLKDFGVLTDFSSDEKRNSVASGSIKNPIFVGVISRLYKVRKNVGDPAIGDALVVILINLLHGGKKEKVRCVFRGNIVNLLQKKGIKKRDVIGILRPVGFITFGCLSLRSGPNDSVVWIFRSKEGCKTSGESSAGVKETNSQASESIEPSESSNSTILDPDYTPSESSQESVVSGKKSTMADRLRKRRRTLDISEDRSPTCSTTSLSSASLQPNQEYRSRPVNLQSIDGDIKKNTGDIKKTTGDIKKTTGDIKRTTRIISSKRLKRETVPVAKESPRREEDTSYSRGICAEENTETVKAMINAEKQVPPAVKTICIPDNIKERHFTSHSSQHRCSCQSPSQNSGQCSRYVKSCCHKSSNNHCRVGWRHMCCRSDCCKPCHWRCCGNNSNCCHICSTYSCNHSCKVDKRHPPADVDCWDHGPSEFKKPEKACSHSSGYKSCHCCNCWSAFNCARHCHCNKKTSHCDHRRPCDSALKSLTDMINRTKHDLVNNQQDDCSSWSDDTCQQRTREWVQNLPSPTRSPSPSIGPPLCTSSAIKKSSADQKKMIYLPQNQKANESVNALSQNVAMPSSFDQIQSSLQRNQEKNQTKGNVSDDGHFILDKLKRVGPTKNKKLFNILEQYSVIIENNSNSNVEQNDTDCSPEPNVQHLGAAVDSLEKNLPECRHKCSSAKNSFSKSNGTVNKSIPCGTKQTGTDGIVESRFTNPIPSTSKTQEIHVFKNSHKRQKDFSVVEKSPCKNCMVVESCITEQTDTGWSIEPIVPHSNPSMIGSQQINSLESKGDSLPKLSTLPEKCACKNNSMVVRSCDTEHTNTGWSVEPNLPYSNPSMLSLQEITSLKSRGECPSNECSVVKKCCCETNRTVVESCNAERTDTGWSIEPDVPHSNPSMFSSQEINLLTNRGEYPSKECSVVEKCDCIPLHPSNQMLSTEKVPLHDPTVPQSIKNAIDTTKVHQPSDEYSSSKLNVTHSVSIRCAADKILSSESRSEVTAEDKFINSNNSMDPLKRKSQNTLPEDVVLVDKDNFDQIHGAPKNTSSEVIRKDTVQVSGNEIVEKPAVVVSNHKDNVYLDETMIDVSGNKSLLKELPLQNCSCLNGFVECCQNRKGYSKPLENNDEENLKNNSVNDNALDDPSQLQTLKQSSIPSRDNNQQSLSSGDNVLICDNDGVETAECIDAIMHIIDETPEKTSNHSVGGPMTTNLGAPLKKKRKRRGAKSSVSDAMSIAESHMTDDTLDLDILIDNASEVSSNSYFDADLYTTPKQQANAFDDVEHDSWIVKPLNQFLDTAPRQNVKLLTSESIPLALSHTHFTEVTGVILDIFPNALENYYSILTGYCSTGCNKRFGYQEFKNVDEFTTPFTTCAACKYRRHLLCPDCLNQGKKRPMCTVFSFDIHFLVLDNVLRLEVLCQDAVVFLGCTPAIYLFGGGYKKVQKLLEKVIVPPSELKTKKPLYQLEAKIQLKSKGSVDALSLVKTSLKKNIVFNT